MDRPLGTLMRLHLLLSLCTCSNLLLPIQGLVLLHFLSLLCGLRARSHPVCVDLFSNVLLTDSPFHVCLLMKTSLKTLDPHTCFNIFHQCVISAYIYSLKTKDTNGRLECLKWIWIENYLYLQVHQSSRVNWRWWQWWGRTVCCAAWHHRSPGSSTEVSHGTRCVLVSMRLLYSNKSLSPSYLISLSHAICAEHVQTCHMEGNYYRKQRHVRPVWI